MSSKQPKHKKIWDFLFTHDLSLKYSFMKSGGIGYEIILDKRNDAFFQILKDQMFVRDVQCV